MSRAARFSSAQRPGARVFKAGEESKLGRGTAPLQKWRFSDNKKPLCLQYTTHSQSYAKYARKVAANTARNRNRHSKGKL